MILFSNGTASGRTVSGLIVSDEVKMRPHPVALDRLRCDAALFDRLRMRPDADSLSKNETGCGLIPKMSSDADHSLG